MTTITDTGHRLNHVEMVYRPGERALAGQVFELLGMRVLDRGGTWMTALVDPELGDFSNNACYASEVTPEQWALEQTLAAAIERGDAEHGSVGATARAYLERLRTEPQRSFHFGIRFHSRDDFDATLERVRGAGSDPELGERVGLSAVFHPDEPGAAAPNMIQAFVRTDVVAAGVLAFGQHVELQWHLPVTPST
jgi:catechol 2,3-dioxygenase-like lactoylglutathione lyase family enzyme